MRVVTGATPQAVARLTLAGALLKLLDVAIHLEIARPRGHEAGDEIGQSVARAVVREVAARARNAGLAGQMALGADGIAARRRKPGGVHHFGLAFDVLGTGPVAALARNTILSKRRIAVGVDRALSPTRLAGVAEEAGWLDGPAPAGCGIGRVAGRDVPGTGLRVPRDRRLEEESVADEAKAPAGSSRADVVAELALLSLLAPGEPDQAVGIDVITDLGCGVAE